MLKSTISFYLVILFFIPSLANGDDEVKQYNMDTYWVSQGKDGIVKIAAFNEGNTYKIDSYMLPSFYDEVVEYVKNELGADVAAGAINLSLRMSVADTKIMMNINQDGYGFCAWGNLVRDGIKLNIVTITENEKGNCVGYMPGIILGKFANDGVLPEVKLEQLMAKYPEILDGELFDFLPGRFTLTIKKEFYFQDSKLYNELKNSKDIVSLERDHPRGFGDIRIIPLEYLGFDNSYSNN